MILLVGSSLFNLLTLCIGETPKRVLLQTVKSQISRIYMSAGDLLNLLNELTEENR